MKQRILLVLLLLVIAAAGHILAYYVVRIPTQLELVVLLGLALFYPVLRNPLLGLYIVFILLPFVPYIRRLYYLAYQRPATDPLIAIGDLFMAVIMLGLFFEFSERRGADRDVRGFKVTVIIYFFVMLSRVFVFNTAPLQQAIAIFKFYGLPVPFFLIGLVYAHRIADMKRLWTVTMAISIAGTLYGINQLLFGYSKAEEIWFTSITFDSLFIKGVPRPFSVFQAPAAFADYCQVGIVAVLMVAAWSRLNGRFLLYAAVPLNVYAILMTSVRSSWVGMILSVFLWPVVLRIKSTGKRFGAVALAVLLYLVYDTVAEMAGGVNMATVLQSVTGGLGNAQFMEQLVANRTSAITDPLQEHSLLSRLALWRLILEESLGPDMALVGRGLGSFRADSLYFTYLAEFGYPGAVFIIGFLGVLIWTGFRALDRSSSSDVRTMIAGITVLNIVFAVVGITGSHIHSFPGDLYFWFWNGVLVKLAVTCTGQKEERQPGESTGNT